MPYQATVIPVMIASPSDVHEYRALARDVIHDWNFVHSTEASAVLMPVGWETHSSPELGSSPQDLINDRVLEECDLLVGIFWTRLGTPTGKSASGTVEEIERHVAAGKPAMVYFSRAPASLETVDAEQYAALLTFRKWCEGKGLIEVFDNAFDFQTKFRRQLQISLQKSQYLKGLVSQLPVTGGFGVPSVQQTPANPLAELAASLIPEAQTLIGEAAKDPSGSIYKLATMGGRFIQTNGKSFGEPSDRRSSARWEHAMDQLVNGEFVVARGFKGEVFEMTEAGYQLADFIQAKLGNA